MACDRPSAVTLDDIASAFLQGSPSLGWPASASRPPSHYRTGAAHRQHGCSLRPWQDGCRQDAASSIGRGWRTAASLMSCLVIIVTSWPTPGAMIAVTAPSSLPPVLLVGDHGVEHMRRQGPRPHVLERTHGLDVRVHRRQAALADLLRVDPMGAYGGVQRLVDRGITCMCSIPLFFRDMIRSRSFGLQTTGVFSISWRPFILGFPHRGDRPRLDITLQGMPATPSGHARSVHAGTP